MRCALRMTEIHILEASINQWFMSVFEQPISFFHKWEGYNLLGGHIIPPYLETSFIEFYTNFNFPR